MTHKLTSESTSENIIGNWKINCTLFIKEAKLKGKLSVCNSSLTFRSNSTDDYSDILEIISKSLIGQNTPNHRIAIDIYRQWLKNNLFVIPKSEIQSISEVKSIFNKEIVLNLSDSSKVTFSSGLIGSSKLYKAIMQ